MIVRVPSDVRLFLCFFVIAVISLLYFLANARSFQSWRGSPSTELQSDSEDPCKGYLVCSPSCHIPDVDPWHESIREFVTDYPPVVCSTLPPLSVVEDNTVKFVPEAANHYTSDDPSTLQCCYHEITRTNTSTKSVDSDFSITDCSLLEDSVPLTHEQQFIMVKCYEDNSSEAIYTNLHAVVQVTPSVKQKLRESKAPSDRKMSVLIIGIDSVSGLNLIRKMPRTVEFLDETGWIEMVGYNKIADNTFPNLMAILTGMDPDDVKETCWKTRDTFLDDCPYIWKNFSDEGYVTSLVEDVSWMGTFNYEKLGFLKPPVDYYFRPFMCAAEKHTKIKYVDINMAACVGPTRESDHIYNYAKEFTNTFKEERYFGLFWINSLSHNNMNRPSALDEHNAQFLQDLMSNGIMNNSLVIFLSDHGMRFGKIRETYVGWLEERLPFFFLWVPEWYRKLYPEKYENLLVNQNRLTSPFDLHLTLQEVLYDSSPKGSVSCPNCLSLFEEIPHNRSCPEAGITDHWCTCSQYQTLPVDNPLAKSMADFTISEINRLLNTNKDKITSGYKCSELSLKSITSVRSKLDAKMSYEQYTINIVALPSEAMFEATISNKDHFKILGTVSRINAYGNQSSCANEAFLKLYCFCV